MLLVFKFLVCEVGHWIACAQVSKFMVWVCGCVASHWTRNGLTTMSYNNSIGLAIAQKVASTW
jgi:hypothetical protein